MAWGGSYQNPTTNYPSYQTTGHVSAPMQQANNQYYQQWLRGAFHPGTPAGSGYQPGSVHRNTGGWHSTPRQQGPSSGPISPYSPPAPSQPTMATIGSQVNPQPLWSPDQTQIAINQQAADIFSANDPNMLLKQYTRPGVSRDEGTLGLIAPQLGDAAANVQQVRSAQPVLDFLANQRSMLQGQQLQGQEGLGMANTLLGHQGVSDQRQQSLVSSILSALMGMAA